MDVYLYCLNMYRLINARQTITKYIRDKQAFICYNRVMKSTFHKYFLSKSVYKYDNEKSW